MGLGLSLAFVLICHVLPLPPSVSAEEGSNSTNTTCEKQFHCGNLAGSSFPSFDPLQLPGCGFYMLDCEAKPVPQIAFGPPPAPWFSVIEESDSAITLRDDFLEKLLLSFRQPLSGSRSCDVFFDYGDKLLPKSSPSISYSTLPNITLYRCPRDPATNQLLIDGFFRGYQQYDKCDDVIIYNQNPGHPAPGKLDFDGTIQAGCKSVTLPMIMVPGDDYSSKTDLFQLLTPEFDLEWHLSDDCHTCHSEGLECPTDWSQPVHALCAHSNKGKNKLRVILCTAAFAGCLAILVILTCFQKKYSFLHIWSKTEKFQNVEDFLKNYGSLAPKRYHYSEVKKMTNSFKIKLGQGGYGCVYKGMLRDGSPVAVKVLKELKGSGEEFINEVASISRTYHINIVTLLGFCFQGHKRALIYEFMPNGSLEKFIYGGKSLTDRQLGWPILYKIAVGIARGLEYLHRGCNTRILHFDIKPHNILLDESFCPKISDFGLAKLCLQKESIVSILGARGTVGYIAPEVFCKNIGGVSHKSDVYSYGMMVFEMVGGRRNIDVGVDHSSEIYFPHWIYARLDRGEQDLGLCGISNLEENEIARKMIIVSLWCIQTDPVNRPSMSKVVEMLEGNLQALETPPKPFLSSPARASADSSTIYPSATVSSFL